jgi:transcriptional regulator with XRE-family HTH domain
MLRSVKTLFVKRMKIGINRGSALVKLIEDFCDQQGWSLREFARRSGIRHSTISGWKNSDVEPDTRSLQKIGVVMALEFTDLWARLNQAVEQQPVDDVLIKLEEMPAEDLIRLIEKASGVLASKFVAA